MAALILWVQALAALLFAVGAAVAIGQRRRALGVALGVSAAAALAAAGLAWGDPGITVATALREAAWVAAIVALLRRHAGRDASLVALAASVVAVNVAAMAVAMLATLPATHGAASLLFATGVALRMTALAGGLILAHHVVHLAGRARDARAAGIALGLGLLWGGELLAALAAWAAGGWPPALLAAQSGVGLAAAGVMAAAITHRRDMPMTVSRIVAWRLVGAAALAGYVAATAALAGYAGVLAGTHARVAETAVIFGAGAALLTLVATPALRAWARVKLAKHLFGQRYDYRAEWQRFTAALGGEAPMAERVVRALAGFTDSPAALLLVATGGELAPEAAWNWPDAAMVDEADGFAALLATGWLVELDAAPDGRAAIPAALRTDPRAWVVVPLVHDEALVAAVVLARPPVDRRLDWEDFDLLRIAGRQAASHLAEDRARAALAEARRFDEFHRRFAFIMHDLKNLGSQMALTASNARRHADKPEFRADMVATLGDCAERMNALIGRLSSHGDQPAEPLAAVDPAAIARGVARRFPDHPIAVEGEATLALAHSARLEQVLAHLVQNAVEASDGTPVTVSVASRGGRVAIEVSDHGAGMSATFVRDRLFHPFASSKPGGFGLGAFEARQLVSAMGGSLAVDSREGEGTSFTILLPTASHRELAA